MRTKVDWRTAGKENYVSFCKKHPDIKLPYDQWQKILYAFNDSFRTYILETGEKGRLPFGLGEFSINKKKRKRTTGINNEFINLPIDWKKTKEKGRYIYNFNYHTEGYFFGWMWFKSSTMFKHADLWYFKPSRVTSRLINHYIKTDNKHQHKYKEWLKI